MIFVWDDGDEMENMCYDVYMMSLSEEEVFEEVKVFVYWIFGEIEL